MSEAHKVYGAVQQAKPVYPMKINLGIDRSIQPMSQPAAVNPYAATLHKNFDSEFQEEPMSALNDADLSWSILTTHVQYTKAAEYSCFKPMNDSLLFQSFKEQNFSGAECDQDVSGEHFEEVSCELSNLSNVEEHVDVMTTYLGRYMAQGGPRTFNSENVISLDGKGITVGHLFDRIELRVFYDSGASKSYMLKAFYEKMECLHRILKMRSTCT